MFPYAGAKSYVFWILVASLVPTHMSAANHYVRAGASGTRSGTDWTNAYTSLPATLTRGDAYYIADGAYGSYRFDDAVSGSLTITVKKATSFDHGTSAGWQDAYGAGAASFNGVIFSTSNYILDGSTGGGPGNWETGFGFKIKGNGHVIDFPAIVSNITLRHLDVSSDGWSSATETDLVYLVNRFTNITVSYCFLHDVSRTMILTWPAKGSGFTLEYSKLARNGTAEHREAWSAGPDSNVIVRYNLFEDIHGTGFIAIVNNNGDAANWDIYGNVFYYTGTLDYDGINTGVIMNRYDGAGGPINVRAVNWNIYNNAFVNIPGFTSAIYSQSSLNYVVENNIWFNNRANVAGVQGATTEDYNWFYGNYRGSSNIDSISKGGAHDVVGSSNPFIAWRSGDWRPTFPIPGLALSSAYKYDALGNARGQDGTWDRGPYEFASQASVLLPPTNLTISVR